MPDYIYFLHDRTTNTVKIGTSTDPEQRMKVLQASTPLDLVPLRVVPVEFGYATEHALHVQFASLRVRGEWFRATPELLDFALHGELPSVVQAPMAAEPVGVPGTALSITALETLSGVSARTIRFYIAEKVLHPPVTRGRTAYYDENHLKRLAEIQRLRQAGLALRDIQQQPVMSQVVARPHELVEYHLSGDVRVQISGRLAPWRKKIVLQALGSLERDLGDIDTIIEEDEDR